MNNRLIVFYLIGLLLCGGGLLSAMDPNNAALIQQLGNMTIEQAKRVLQEHPDSPLGQAVKTMFEDNGESPLSQQLSASVPSQVRTQAQNELQQAFQNGFIDARILEYLKDGASLAIAIRGGCDINTISPTPNALGNKGGDSLLHVLAAYGKRPLLNDILINFHPNPAIRNGAGLTPIDLLRHHINQHRQQIEKVDGDITQARAERQKVLSIYDEAVKKRLDPDETKWSDEDKKWQQTAANAKAKRSAELRGPITLLQNKRATLQVSLDRFVSMHDVLSRYASYYEAGIPQRFTINEPQSYKFFASMVPKVKGVFCVILLTSGVVGLSALVDTMIKRHAHSRLSLLKSKLLKIKTSLLNIDFDIHNAESVFKPVEEMCDIELFAYDAEQQQKLEAAITRFDELVLTLSDRIKEKYFYHPASYFIEQESALVSDLEQVHTAINSMLDDGQQLVSIKKPMKRLGGSALVAVASWWCYKHIHPLKRWGLF